MALKKLNLIRGDSHPLTLNFSSSGNPVCIKNWTVFFTLKTHWALPDSQASLQKIVTSFADSTSGTSGVAVVNILPADTANLDPGKYDFDVAVCTETSKNYTVLRGQAEIEYDVTQTAGTAGTAL